MMTRQAKTMNYNQPRTRIILFLLLILFSATIAYGTTVKRTSLQVNNLSCTSCLTTIEEGLMGLRGALGMTGDLRTGVIIVDHEPALADETIAEAITGIGYPATVDWNADIAADQTFTFGSTPRSAAGCNGGCNRSGDAAAGSQVWNPQAAQSAKVVRTSLQVSNLSCSSCLTNIASELQGLTGTVGMTGDLTRGIVVVDHLQTMPGEKIAASISRIGYPARIISTTGKAIIQNRPGATQAPSTASRFSISNCNRRSCSATASAWKELYRRYITKTFGN
jgi:copper chaperone CopZ